MFSAETIDTVTRFAHEIDIEPATLLAVIEVESGGRTHAEVSGRREPLIRFEGHYFDRRLSPPDREKARFEGLASPNAGAVHNPPSQTARWRLLNRAVEINRQAAYESTSWGIGQVMGAHWAWLGYASIDALVTEARSGLAGQLALTVRYIEKAGLLEALRRHDWTAFARGYNGPGYSRNSYHLRLSLAYRRHNRNIKRTAEETAVPPRLLQSGDQGETVRHLQRLLGTRGYPVAIDGIFGPRTRDAVIRFQRDQALDADGIIGPQTWRALKDATPADKAGRIAGHAGRTLWDRLPGVFARRNV